MESKLLPLLAEKSKKNIPKISKDFGLHGEGGRMQPRYADHGHDS
jgi:hypothetical protein